LFITTCIDKLPPITQTATCYYQSIQSKVEATPLNWLIFALSS